jgi:hypothetical protein
VGSLGNKPTGERLMDGCNVTDVEVFFMRDEIDQRGFEVVAAEMSNCVADLQQFDDRVEITFWDDADEDMKRRFMAFLEALDQMAAAPKH